MNYLLLTLLSALWGSSFLLIAIAARGFDPTTLALIRVAIGALGLWTIALSTNWRWPRGRALWLRLAVMAAFGQAAPFFLLGAAARTATSGDLALMMGAAPIFAFLQAHGLGEGRKLTRSVALGLALGVVGVAVAVGGPGGGVSTLAGRAEGLAAAFLYALGATLSRGASKQIGAATAAAVSMTLSCLLLGALWLVSGKATIPLANVPSTSLIAIVALGVLNTALAYYVYFALVARAGATFATLNNYAVPFVGLILGAFFLQEAIAPTAWIGLILVIAGIALTGRVSTPAASRTDAASLTAK